MKIRSKAETGQYRFPTELYDLACDPGQERPIKDGNMEQMMIRHMVRLMKKNDAPQEQFKRIGLPLDMEADN